VLQTNLRIRLLACEQFDDRAEEEKDDDDDDGENSDKGSPAYRNMAMRDFEQRTDYNFVKPLRVIYQLTRYQV